MSYQQFQLECQGCGKIMNAAFGIVGTVQIATPPRVCPDCNSTELKKVADFWEIPSSPRQAFS